MKYQRIHLEKRIKIYYFLENDKNLRKIANFFKYFAI